MILFKNIYIYVTTDTNCKTKVNKGNIYEVKNSMYL